MSVYLLLLCLACLQQVGAASTEPPGCSSPEVARVAEEALERINQDRTSGYVLSLNRVYDLARTPEKEEEASLYTLTIDVMETKCHIYSRKPWTQCEVRNLDEVPVYGECEVSAYSGPQVKLHNYSCALREVPATAVVNVCPDCPTSENLSEPVVKETVSLALQRFNDESRLANYFTLENITRASSQWVVGPSYFVEFTIAETVCSRTTDPSELGSCPRMDCQFAHRGFCYGSHVAQEDEFEIKSPVARSGCPECASRQNRKSVEVKCEIYEPQAAAVEEQAHATAGGDHAAHQHQNHTHLHAHAPAPEHAGSRPGGSLGSVVDQPASPRSAPAAGSCPGQRRHNLGLRGLKL